MTLRNKTRRTEIAQTWATGITLEETGAKFGITRERVRQIIQNPGLREYHARRRAASLEFVGKYNPTPVCQRCRELFEPNKSEKRPGIAAGLCSSCGTKLHIVRQVQSHLRRLSVTYRLHGRWDSPQFLNQAVYLIRKHNLKPEDFR